MKRTVQQRKSESKKASLFVGKRVEFIDVSAINCIKFRFDDDTEVLLEVEYAGIPGLYGIEFYTEEGHVE